MAGPSPSSTRAALVASARWTGAVVGYLVLAGLFVGGGVALRAVSTANRAEAAEASRPAEAAPAPAGTTATTWLLETTTTTILFRTGGAPATTTTTLVAPRPQVGVPVASGAPAVPAARAAVWFALADCESGRWGPGKVPVPGTATWDVVDEIHQGGLQIRAGQWDQHRVRFPGFPDDAHLATPEQQIAVAEVILAGQGVRAWPTCGPRTGLDRLVGS